MGLNLRYIFFLIVLLLLSCNNKGKQDLADVNNDSIAKYLKLAGNDSLSFEERDKWNEKAFSLIDLGKNDSLTRFYLGQSSRFYVRTNNKYRYYRKSKLHLEKSSKAKDTLNIARYYRYRAAYHKNITKQNDSIFYYYTKAVKFYKKTKDFEGLARVYFHIAGVQNDLNDYLGAELSTNRSYNLIKKRRDDVFTYEILLRIGYINHNLGNFNEAIKNYELALKLIKVLDFDVDEKNSFNSRCYNFIGNSYKELKKYNKAIDYFKKGLKQGNIKSNDAQSYAYIISNLGFCKIQLKQYNGLPQLFIESSRLFDSLKIKDECSLSHVYLSDYYFRIKKDTIKAISYSEKALRIAKESKAPYYYLIALSNAGFVNKNKASKYIKEYHKKNDSIQFEQRKVRNQFYKIQLETHEILQEKESAIKQKWVLGSIISSVLLIVILLFVIYRQRTKQKELQLLQVQQKGNEEIYHLMLNQQAKVEEARQIEKKRIALELHDGIMNKLASTRLNLFVLSKKTDPETINKCLTYIEDIHHIENEIRNVSHELNQELFIEKDSFKTLLKQFLSEQNSHLKTNYELQIDKNINWDLISSEIKMHFYRIIQEAARNSNKYARATKAIICFTMDENQLCMSITDNGIGFDSEKIKEGIGLLNMKQRIQSLNGTLSIESKAKNGTAIYIKIPL